MNEQIEDRLIASMDKVFEWVESAESFTVEQAPLVAQEIIRWEIVRGGFGVVAGIILLVFGYIFFRAYIKIKKLADDSHPSFTYRITPISEDVLSVSGPSMVLVGSLLISLSGLSLTHALVAPRLVILEKIAQYL